MSRLIARSPSDLWILDHLTAPIWIFDIEQYGIVWANDAALAFWKAPTLGDLKARDFSTDSANVQLRLRQWVAQREGSPRFREVWTLYPGGVPMTADICCQPIDFEGRSATLLVEITNHLAPESDARVTRRRELVRYADTILGMYAMSGELLIENERSFACYGPGTREAGVSLEQRLSDPQAVENLLAAVAEDRAFDAELDVKTATGPRIHRIRASKGRDPVTGKVVAVVSEDDITEVATLRRELGELNADLERRVSERSRSLKISEERFALAMKGTNEGLWDVDVITGDTYLSPRWFDMLGYGPNDLPATPRTIQSLVHPDDLPHVRKEILEADPADGRSLEAEVRLKHREGHFVDVLLRAFLVVRDGKVVRIVGTHVDITERKRSERTLRRLREILVEGSEALPVGVAYYDQDDRLVMNNSLYARMKPSCADILAPGVSFAEIVRRCADEILLPPGQGTAADYAERRLREARSGSGIWENEYRNGRTMRTRDIPTSGNGIVSVVEDITEERSRQKQLLQSQKMESIGQLTGGVAHDFNNLLAVIMGNLELLEMDLEASGTATEETNNLIHTAIGAVRHGAELTGSMLAYARKAQLAPTTVDVNETVRQTEQWMRRTIEANIDIETVLQAGAWKVRLDRSSLQSALINLILNARDAMPGGGRLTLETANVRIDETYLADRQETIPPGRYVMIAISDTGTGIPEEVIDSIYDPFFTTKAVGKGSGLGLSMVEGFARQSGGAVQVYSEKDIGTSFKLYFRAMDPEGKRVAAAEEVGRDRGTAPAAAKGRILLAEDREEVMIVLQKTLTSAGYSVVAAETGDLAYAIFKADPAFDAVLTDIVMPGELQGPGLAKACRKLRPDVPFVFLSGYASEATVHGNGLLPDDVRLIKPVSRVALLKVIETILAKAADGK